MDITSVAVTAGFVINGIAVGAAIYKLGRAVEKFEHIGTQQAKEINQLKVGVDKIGDIVTKIAVTNERQDSFAQRLNQMDQRLDELRHGDGFVLPMIKSKPSSG